MNKLLYVDDDSMNLYVFEIQFQDQFEVITCSDPLEAESILVNESISVLVTDYRMPKLNGMELIRDVKKSHPETICILLTGYNKKELSLDDGLIYDTFSKPFDVNHLSSVLTKAFEAQQQSA